MTKCSECGEEMHHEIVVTYNPEVASWLELHKIRHILEKLVGKQ